MQGTEQKDAALLRRLLDECVTCAEMFRENVALLTDGDRLTPEQIAEVLVLLLDAHRKHR